MEQRYDRLSDEEIISRYRNGDTAAIDFLLEKYKFLVRKKARTLYLIGGENDDLIQEGMIALYRAIREYTPDCADPVSGFACSFAAFAETCITNQLYNVIKGANRLKNSPLNSYISLYSPLKPSDEAAGETLADTLQPAKLINPEDILIDRENVSVLENAMEHKLSAFEKEVVNLYIDGMGYQQIAKRLNKSTKSIDNALQRVKKKLAK